MRRLSSLALVLALAFGGAASVSAQEPETLRLKASDQQEIAAELHRPEADPPAGGVVLLHMYRSSRIAWRPLIPHLLERGLMVVAIDLRGHGESAKGPDGKTVSVGREVLASPDNPFLKMHLDAQAAAALLVARGAPKDRIAYAGASVGCSVALHALAERPGEARAAVLMTPGTNYLGVPSMEHVRKLETRDLLILSTEEEAEGGALPLHRALEEKSSFELLPGRNRHGTQALGAVPGIEAKIAEWLAARLKPSEALTVPYELNVLLDGSLGESEAKGALRFEVKSEEHPALKVRLCRNKRSLVVGLKMGERCMRRNTATLLLCTAERPPNLLDETCWKLSFAPAKDPSAPLSIQRGSAGGWIPVEKKPRGVLVYGNTREPSHWSAEFSLHLERFLAGKRSLWVAFLAQGAVSSVRYGWPEDSMLEARPVGWKRILIAERP